MNRFDVCVLWERCHAQPMDRSCCPHRRSRGRPRVHADRAGRGERADGMRVKRDADRGAIESDADQPPLGNSPPYR